MGEEIDRYRRFSFSSIKSVLYGGCEARAIGENFQGNEATATGLIVEDLVCGIEPDQELLQKYFISKKDGKMKMNYGKMMNYVAQLLGNKVMQKILSKSEKQVSFEMDYKGMVVKGIADFVTEDTIWDLKVVKSVTDLGYSEDHGMRVPFYVAYRYALQAALYTRGLGKKYANLIAIGKDTGEVRVIKFSEEVLEKAWEDFRQNAEYVYEVINHKRPAKRCERCAYCASTREKTMVEVSEIY